MIPSVRGVRVGRSPGRGAGTFATATIPEGAVIELCPAHELPEGDVGPVNRARLWEFYFVGRDDPARKIFAWGACSLANHADDPNSEVDFVTTETGLCAVWRATRRIETGEEVVIAYPNVDEYPDSGEWAR